MLQQTLSLDEVEILSERIFSSLGLSAEDASTMAKTIRLAERDGNRGMGLSMLPKYASSLGAGWINATAKPRQQNAMPGVVSVDGDNGLMRISHRFARPLVLDTARTSGVAILAIANAHHLGALGHDVEPYAEDGLTALTCVVTRPYVAPWGGASRVLGTDPIAFACPISGRPPLVFDQATSRVAVNVVWRAAVAGEPLAGAYGFDAAGKETDNAKSILAGGALSPAGDHKGTALALMVEALAAALTGGLFSHQDASATVKGAESHRGGQFLLVIATDSLRPDYQARMAGLLGLITEDGAVRVPGDGRLARRQRHDEEGVCVDAEFLEQLQAMANAAADGN